MIAHIQGIGISQQKHLSRSPVGFHGVHLWKRQGISFWR